MALERYWTLSNIHVLMRGIKTITITANPRLDICQTQRQTAEVNLYHCHIFKWFSSIWRSVRGFQKLSYSMFVRLPVVILSDRLCTTWLTSFNVKMLWMNNILFCGIIIIFIFCVALCEANAQMMPLPPVITLSDVNGTLKRYWTPSNMHVLMRGIKTNLPSDWKRLNAGNGII